MAVQISAILPTADDFSGIRETVHALRAQTARQSIELVIVVPAANVTIPADEVEGFGAVKVVNGGPLKTSNISRVAGIRAATAPIVVMCEDHSFPEPGWAQAFIDAHKGNFAVVGPAIRNANPRTMLSWAGLLLEYGPWLEGPSRQEMPEVGGHNSSYKREQLIAFGDRLEEVFEAESLVQRELLEGGERILFEPSAVTNHLNFSRLSPSLGLRFNAGRSFAGHRVIGWSMLRRIGFALGSPLIPVVRFVRIVRLIAQSQHYKFLLPQVLPALALYVLVDGVGEMAGYLTGPGDAPAFLGSIEFNRRRFMNAEDCADLDGRIVTRVPDARTNSAPVTA
jgi:hypothetical protein